MADSLGETHEARKGFWTFFLDCAFWMLIGWAGDHVGVTCCWHCSKMGWLSFVARTESSICHFILHQKCLLYPGLKRETLWAHTLGLLNAPIQSEAVIVSESDLESETMAVDRGGGGEVKKEKKTRTAFCLPFLYRCNPLYTNMNSTIILVHRTTVHMRR